MNAPDKAGHFDDAIETLLIHADQFLNTTSAVSPPIYQTASFRSESAQEFIRRAGEPRVLKRRSAARALGLKPELVQLGYDAVAMISLDLDHAVLYGAACAAQSLQARRKVTELGPVVGQAADDGDALAGAAGDLTAHTHACGHGAGVGPRPLMIDRAWRLGTHRIPKNHAAEGLSGLHVVLPG